MIGSRRVAAKLTSALNNLLNALPFHERRYLVWSTFDCNGMILLVLPVLELVEDGDEPVVAAEPVDLLSRAGVEVAQDGARVLEGAGLAQQPHRVPLHLHLGRALPQDVTQLRARRRVLSVEGRGGGT